MLSFDFSTSPAGRRAALRGGGAALLLALAGLPAQAQTADWPQKPVQMVLSFPAAGATDILARAVGQKMSEALGQSVVVENRPGAGGNIGLLHAAKAAPDGHTVYMAAVTNAAIAAAAYPPQQAHLVKDFVPVAGVAIIPHMLVVPASLPAQSVGQLIGLLKKEPGRHNFASQGAGTLSHLESEVFKASAGLDIVHIPYKGSSQALPDLMAGSASLMFDSIPASMPHVKSGKLRVLAVASSKRIAMLPDVPTVAESGVKGFAADNVFGVVAPKGTPPAALAALAKAVRFAMESPELRQRMQEQGVELRYTPADEFGKLIGDEFRTWGRAVEQAKVRLE
ncbi:Bug family tripartite tricarboxylate transporter substrate binding protein [Ramlibacter tataouinensis]|uniref:Candidate extracytoplasmic binding receptor n=1 Tax=Ramlibacter tataouinensis (strain ATCC BAA-407 / DSM 14655 / LMG 21543 / TTB310) TaxID=365046 RepID=F5XXY5_RAMTT|nr:tripartite tricarboxylate transporter substrate binding protein [Ramlibacter tataouinensis]AEG93120.1 Candidate extracytoplasmic binding receptor [Ramlibacter tataouinensis TTB310]